MSRLPGFIKESLGTISSATARPEDLVSAVGGLLDAERRLENLSRSVEAFREAMRSLGILDESRNGQKIWDGWAKLSRFFLAPLLGGSTVLSGKAVEYEKVPVGFEAVGTRWERMIPEVEAFVAEERALDRSLAEAPVEAHVGFRFRSRLLLLDRRAERIKVALDLVRRDLTYAARQGVEQLSNALGGRQKSGGRGGKSDDGGGSS